MRGQDRDKHFQKQMGLPPRTAQIKSPDSLNRRGTNNRLRCLPTHRVRTLAHHTILAPCAPRLRKHNPALHRPVPCSSRTPATVVVVAVVVVVVVGVRTMPMHPCRNRLHPTGRASGCACACGCTMARRTTVHGSSSTPPCLLSRICTSR